MSRSPRGSPCTYMHVSKSDLSPKTQTVESLDCPLRRCKGPLEPCCHHAHHTNDVNTSVLPPVTTDSLIPTASAKSLEPLVTSLHLTPTSYPSANLVGLKIDSESDQSQHRVCQQPGLQGCHLSPGLLQRCPSWSPCFCFCLCSLLSAEV